MANKQWQELQKKSNQDLRLLEEQIRAELFALRFQNAMGSLEKSHQIPILKRKIARILTLLTERKNQGDNVIENLNAKALQSEYKKTMDRMETENEAFRKKMEAQMRASQPSLDPDMVDAETLNAALDASTTESDDQSATVEAQGTIKTTTNNTKEGKE